MVDFKIINDSQVWNESLNRHNNSNPYQVFGWGQYKNALNWSSISICAESNKKQAQLQITYKIKFGMFFGWCVGSIAGNVELFSKDDLIAYLKNEFNVRQVLIRSSFTNKLDSQESLDLFTAGWDKSFKKICTDYSIYVDLSKDIEAIYSGFSKNFKRNVKRGQNANPLNKISLLKNFDEHELFAVFNRFEDIKGIPAPGIDEITAIKQHLGHNILVATSEISGQVVGLRACLFFNDKAIDFWAATDSVGRKHYTSYILLYLLLDKAKEENVKSYDMGGIDPRNNSSVFGFKYGTRAEISERLGQWEISSSKLLTFLVNYFYMK